MIKKINFKKNKNDVFVTFWWVVDMHRNYVPIAIRCKDYENAREVASDVYSLLGVQYLYINENGKIHTPAGNAKHSAGKRRWRHNTFCGFSAHYNLGLYTNLEVLVSLDFF